MHLKVHAVKCLARMKNYPQKPMIIIRRHIYYLFLKIEHPVIYSKLQRATQALRRFEITQHSQFKLRGGQTTN